MKAALTVTALFSPGTQALSCGFKPRSIIPHRDTSSDSSVTSRVPEVPAPERLFPSPPPLAVTVYFSYSQLISIPIHSHHHTFVMTAPLCCCSTKSQGVCGSCRSPVGTAGSAKPLGAAVVQKRLQVCPEGLPQGALSSHWPFCEHTENGNGSDIPSQRHCHHHRQVPSPTDSSSQAGRSPSPLPQHCSAVTAGMLHPYLQRERGRGPH